MPPVANDLKKQVTRKLRDQLLAVGLKITSLGVDIATHSVTLELTPPVAPEQNAQAAAIIAAFDWLAPPVRRARTVAAIKADIDAALPTIASARAVLHTFLAIEARQRPDLLRRLGLQIDGDEPVQ